MRFEQDDRTAGWWCVPFVNNNTLGSAQQKTRFDKVLATETSMSARMLNNDAFPHVLEIVAIGPIFFSAQTNLF